MSKFWTTTLVTASLLVAGLSWGAQADVTGAFDIDLSLTPQTNSQEAVPFFFDLQSNLQVNATLSGMTFGLDVGFGTTGLEFAILSVGTNLGALTLKDQFVFAPPFGCSAPSWIGVAATLSDDTDGGIAGQCRGQFVSPVGTTTGSGPPDGGAIAFVKKHVDMQVDIAGISIGVLAIFEDVDFPDIHGAESEALIGVAGGSDHEHDHFRGGDLYFVSMADAVVDNQTPSFGFGTVLTVTGQTVSGITVTNIAGLCADAMLNNRIKKRKFAGEVNKGCVAEDGPLFTFDVEKLLIEGVEVGGVNLSTLLLFKPLQPVSGTIELSFSLAGLANVKGTFESDNLMSLMIDTIVVSLNAGNFSLVLEDLDANLQVDRSTARVSLTLNPNQNPAGFTSTTVAEAGIGVTSQEFELTVTRSGLTIALTAGFLHNGANLSWDNTSFTLSAKLNVITFSADVAFNTTGLQVARLNLSVGF